MPIPGLPAPLPSVTGGPATATATSGDIKGDSAVSVGGISSPVVIGGFKTDGTATSGALPSWALLVGGGIALLVVGVFLYRKFYK